MFRLFAVFATLAAVLLLPGVGISPLRAAGVEVVGGVGWPGAKLQIFFNNGSYARYDVAGDRVDEGYPKPVDDRTWPGLGGHGRDIVAVTPGLGGKLYFFLADGTYIRYDVAADRADDGYPQPVNDRTWPGLGRHARSIVGVMAWPGDKLQIFLDNATYLRYDLRADSVEAGYPKPVNNKTWPGMEAYRGRVAGVVNWNQRHAYLFLTDGSFLRYDIARDRVAEGYPRAVNGATWPGLDKILGLGGDKSYTPGPGPGPAPRRGS